MKSRKDSKGRVLQVGEYERRDGRYSYQYTDKYGKSHMIYAHTLPDLRKQKERIQSDIAEGIDSYSANTTTLNQLFDRYIKTKTSLKETTRANYIYMYDTYVRQNFGKLMLSKIRYSDVIKFYKELLDEKLAINTLETIQTVLHPTFTMAVRDNLIRNNPTDCVIGELKKNQELTGGVRRALTEEQQKAFLTHCKTSRVFWRWHPLFVVMFGTGCRVGEIVGLRWQDVDLDKRLININHTLSDHSIIDEDGRRYNPLRITTTKTKAGRRIVPMIDSVYNAFIEEKAYQERFGSNTAEIQGITGFVFQNRNGNVFRACIINRAIERIRLDYNTQEEIRARKENRDPILIPYFTCHHIRHTFCTRFCERETNIKVIQEIMGHADFKTTMDIYAEATANKKVDSIKKLSKSLDVF